MKALAVSALGFEDISKKEIKDLLGKNAEVIEGGVVFKIDSKESLAKFTYTTQSSIRVIKLLEKFDFLKSKKFCIEAIKVNTDKSSSDMIEELKEKILSNVKAKFTYSEPDYTLILFMNSKETYIGLDYSGFDLSKRDYNLFPNKFGVRGNIAYCLLMYGEYSPKDVLVDPFCKNGPILIEAACFASKKSINYYQKDKFAFNNFLKYEFKDQEQKPKAKIYALDPEMTCINATRKNAKIAGVNKYIILSRKEADWIDLKFQKESVDKVITVLPLFTKLGEKKAAKQVNEFLNRSQQILKKDSIVTILTNNKEKFLEILEQYQYKVIDEREIWTGKEKKFSLKLQQNL